MTRTVGLGALRGAAAGAAAVATVALVLVSAVNQLEGLDGSDGLEGLEDLAEVIIVLSLLPAAVLVVSLGVAFAVRLRRWWAVGVVAPFASFLALAPLPRWPVLQAAVTVLIYAAAGAASITIAGREDFR